MAGSSMAFQYDSTGVVKRIIADWVSDDAAGTASFSTKKISGFLLRGVTDPDGVAAPTNAYDIVLTDEEGANILGNCSGDLMDRHNANIENVDFILDGTGSAERPCVCDKILISISAAGNSKAGRLVLYWMGSP